MHNRLAALLCVSSTCLAADAPNVVYIMSDELAYYELSHMGNEKLHTPRIDRMAQEGIRFTHALAGAPVCAPLRCNLMTGKHAGHASVRANDGGTPLRADEETIASLLKAKGYATGGFGKWGCGGRDSTGVPEKHGFDEFFGYYDQVHAHSFYPPYLIRNSEEVPLKGNIGGRSGDTYSHYEIMDRAESFIREHKDKPFFCYLPITPPHGMYDIPKDDPAWKQYENDAWMKDPTVDQEARNYAAMVTMVDNNVGTILDLLKELNLQDNTIVFFTGDNGGQDRFRSPKHPRGYFGPNVDPKTGTEFRAGKGSLYEGGLRIPFMVRWPGKIAAGQESDLIFYQPDILPTLTELCDAATPKDIDGISILPTLLGNTESQKTHEFLYWEYGQQTAVRQNHWKAIRPRSQADWELYDLDKDVSETNNVAADHPDLLKRMVDFAGSAHEPVRAGTYLDPRKVRHEKDRQAKWGTAKAPNKPARLNQKTERLSDKNLLDQSDYSLLSVSSENRANNKLAKYAFDGDPNTIWHSEFSPQRKAHPHELVIDLGATCNVQGIRYLARQDSGWNGAFAKTEVTVSVQKDQFPEPQLKTVFGKTRRAQAGDFEKPVLGRFVRIRVLSEVNNGPWASAAEIGVVGKVLKRE